jgi:hypothetical protein
MHLKKLWIGRMMPVKLVTIFYHNTIHTSRKYNEDYFFSAAERKVNTPNIMNQRLRCQLETILGSYKIAQQLGAVLNIKFQLGNFSKQVGLFVLLQFIFGDVEGGDQLSSCFQDSGI